MDPRQRLAYATPLSRADDDLDVFRSLTADRVHAKTGLMLRTILAVDR